MTTSAEKCLPDSLTPIAPAELYAQLEHDWQSQYQVTPSRASLTDV